MGGQQGPTKDSGEQSDNRSQYALYAHEGWNCGQSEQHSCYRNKDMWDSQGKHPYPTPLCDDKNAIQIAHNSVFHEHAKHIEIDSYFVRRNLQLCLGLGTIDLPFVLSSLVGTLLY